MRGCIALSRTNVNEVIADDWTSGKTYTLGDFARLCQFDKPSFDHLLRARLYALSEEFLVPIEALEHNPLCKKIDVLEPFVARDPQIPRSKNRCPRVFVAHTPDRIVKILVEKIIQFVEYVAGSDCAFLRTDLD